MSKWTGFKTPCFTKGAVCLGDGHTPVQFGRASQETFQTLGQGETGTASAQYILRWLLEAHVSDSFAHNSSSGCCKSYVMAKGTQRVFYYIFKQVSLHWLSLGAKKLHSSSPVTDLKTRLCQFKEQVLTLALGLCALTPGLVLNYRKSKTCSWGSLILRIWCSYLCTPCDIQPTTSSLSLHESVLLPFSFSEAMCRVGKSMGSRICHFLTLGTYTLC